MPQPPGPYEIQAVLHARLLADPDLMALLHTDESHEGVYDEKAPETAVFDYIVIGGTSRDDRPVWFAGQGKGGGVDLRIATRPAQGERPGSGAAKVIYGHVERLLDRQEIDVGNGYRLTAGRVALVTTFVEEDGQTTAAPVRYTFNVALHQ